MTDLLEDGVYLGLPEEEYFAQERLGSSDLKTLYDKREGWWWQSAHNPHRGERSSEATIFGSALHTLMLEGEEAYRSAFAVLPDQRRFPGLLVTASDLIAALQACGEDTGVHPKMKKHDLVQLGLAYLDAPIWDDVVARFERNAAGRQKLTAAEDFQIRTMHEAAQAEPNMRVVCEASGMQRLTEVSVFWTTAEGVRLRFRFDSLLPGWNADLKSIGNLRKELEYAIGDAIATYHYDVQLAMSYEAREAAYRHIEAGKVFGGDAYQREHLMQFPARAPRWRDGQPMWHWLWMFYAKPDDKGQAPVIFPVRVFHGDERHLTGWRKMTTGYRFYIEQVARHGLKKPWSRVEDVHDVNHAGERRVLFPPYEKIPGPVEGEKEAFACPSR